MRIPIVNTTATEIQVEFVSASLLLSVTPQITAEGTIILDVTVENNSPDFVNTAGGIPSIRTQRAQTKVLINDGGTTVIGGIFVVNEGSSEVGVPWFRKIPVFGWLFKQQSIQQENRELADLHHSEDRQAQLGEISRCVERFTSFFPVGGSAGAAGDGVVHEQRPRFERHRRT